MKYNGDHSSIYNHNRHLIYEGTPQNIEVFDASNSYYSNSDPTDGAKSYYNNIKRNLLLCSRGG